jgi:hypothetical protein
MVEVMSDTEKLDLLITRMKAKRRTFGALTEPEAIALHRTQCDWYMEGVRDAIRVLRGEPPTQL